MSDPLPTGTVTFLFTDVEGSTRLLDERRIHALALEAGDVSADFTLGFCLVWSGKPDEATVYLDRGREVARARGASLIETRCMVYGLVARRKLEDVEGARALLAEIEALDELHGYDGLACANASWIAFRDGDLDLAARKGSEALADWRFEGRPSPSPFTWTARFPLLGVAVARRDLDAAREHAEAMLDAVQQPLPAEIEAALEEAVSTGNAASYAHALGGGSSTWLRVVKRAGQHRSGDRSSASG